MSLVCSNLKIYLRLVNTYDNKTNKYRLEYIGILNT